MALVAHNNSAHNNANVAENRKTKLMCDFIHDQRMPAALIFVKMYLRYDIRRFV